MKGMPDLYCCLDCNEEFHRLVEKIKDEASRQNILRIEKGRALDHLTKCSTQAQGNQLDKKYISYARVGLIEVLRHPHLLFMRNTLEQFLKTLTWMIRRCGTDFLEAGAQYPTLYFLLMNDNISIRKWATDALNTRPSVTTKHFQTLGPTIHCVLNVILNNQLTTGATTAQPENIHSIRETTRMPPHLLQGLKEIDIWTSLSVLFNSLDSRVLRNLLVTEKFDGFLDALFATQGNAGSPNNTATFWTRMEIMSVLMGKLKGSFWMIGISTEEPPQIAKRILQNASYQRSKQKVANEHYLSSCRAERDEEIPAETELPHKDPMFPTGDNDYESSNVAALHHTLRLTAESLYSWTIPFVKSIIEMNNEPQQIISMLIEQHVLNTNNNDPESLLSVASAKNLCALVGLLLREQRMDVLKQQRVSISDVILGLVHQPLASDRVNQAYYASSGPLMTSLIEHGRQTSILNVHKLTRCEDTLTNLKMAGTCKLEQLRDAVDRTLQSLTSIKKEAQEEVVATQSLCINDKGVALSNKTFELEAQPAGLEEMELRATATSPPKVTATPESSSEAPQCVDRIGDDPMTSRFWPIPTVSEYWSTCVPNMPTTGESGETMQGGTTEPPLQLHGKETPPKACAPHQGRRSHDFSTDAPPTTGEGGTTHRRAEVATRKASWKSGPHSGGKRRASKSPVNRDRLSKSKAIIDISEMADFERDETVKETLAALTAQKVTAGDYSTCGINSAWSPTVPCLEPLEVLKTRLRIKRDETVKEPPAALTAQEEKNRSNLDQRHKVITVPCLEPLEVLETRMRIKRDETVKKLWLH